MVYVFLYYMSESYDLFILYYVYICTIMSSPIHVYYVPLNIFVNIVFVIMGRLTYWSLK